MLERASASRFLGKWNDDDFDVLVIGIVVGRIFKSNSSPVGSPWMWTLAFGHDEDSHTDAQLRSDARGGHGGVREELAAGV